MAKRGPNYPAFGLKWAIEKARQLHKQDGSAPTAPDVAIQAWGYGSLNGASLRVLAALKQYGLLESAGDNVKLTERALAILLEPDGSAEKAEAIQAAASAPPIFGSIIAEYQVALPSDAALVSYLVRKQGFQERAAQQLVEAFRESYDLAKESPVPHLTENGTEAGLTEAATARDSVQATIVRPGPKRSVPETGGGVMSFNWPLGAMKTVTVAFTQEPVQGDIETLKSYLDIVKGVLPEQVAPPATPVAAAEKT